MQNTRVNNNANQQWNTVVGIIKSRKNFLSEPTILRAIELCLTNNRDNLGRPITNFYDAVYYRANQIWLATGK